MPLCQGLKLSILGRRSSSKNKWDVLRFRGLRERQDGHVSIALPPFHSSVCRRCPLKEAQALRTATQVICGDCPPAAHALSSVDTYIIPSPSPDPPLYKYPFPRVVPQPRTENLVRPSGRRPERRAGKLAFRPYIPRFLRHRPAPKVRSFPISSTIETSRLALSHGRTGGEERAGGLETWLLGFIRHYPPRVEH